MNQNKKRQLIQLIEYLISGGAYFWIGYLTFAVLWSGFRWSLWWAKLGANIVGWTANFLMQRYWVFKNDLLAEHNTQVTGRYVFITLVDFVMDYLIVSGLKSLGLTPYIGQFVSAAFFTGWNYFWYKFWVFPEKFTARSKITPTRILAHRAHGHGGYR